MPVEIFHAHATLPVFTGLNAVLLLGGLAYELLRSFHPTKRLLNFLSQPLCEFLDEGDLLEYVERPRQPRAPQWQTAALRVFTVTLAVAWVNVSAFQLASKGSPEVDDTIRALTWIFLCFKCCFGSSRGPQGLLFTFTSLQVASSLIEYYSNRTDPYWTLMQMMAYTSIIVVELTMPVGHDLPDSRVASIGTIPSASFSSPEDSVTLWSWLSFRWMQPLLDLAAVKTLNAEDVWQLSPFFKHKNLFTKYLAVQSRYPRQSLLSFLFRSNSLDLIITFSVELYKSFAGFVPAYSLQRILAILESHDPARRPEAYTWAIITFVLHCSFAQIDLWGAWHARREYERVRGQLFCALHWKALQRRDMRGQVSEVAEDGKEGEDETQTADIGRVVNLMTGDAYAVAQRFWEFPAVFLAPIRLIIALVFLYNILGWSCFLGVGTVLLAYAVNYPLAMWDVQLTRKSWAAKDARMSVVNEFFQSVRFLKYMGWEGMWSDRVRTARNKELKIKVQQNVVDVLISFIWTWIPSAVTLVSFLAYTLIAKEQLTVSKAFTAIEVFSHLQGDMTELPNQILALLHAFVSMQRINTFLEEDEVEDWASSLKRNNGRSHLTPTDVGFDSASFEWYTAPKSTIHDPQNSNTPSAFTLNDLSVAFPTGRLSLITGATGSGKSSLLNALLGEMKTLHGTVHLDKALGKVAFAAQMPWLQQATIRENILFHSPFDGRRYDQVLECCALKPDLAVFTAGDMTEIGEKGVSLSGGQRARIALARAVYSHATVVLLDDPLAAVDMHTAKHLLHECFSGPLMKGRTILLVTHHVTLCLPVAAYLIEMSNGAIVHQGSIDELEKTGQLQVVIAEVDDVENVLETDAQTALNEADQTRDSDPKLSSAEGQIVEEEHRAEGRVSLHTYLSYMRAVGWLPWSLICALILSLRGVNLGSQLFLAKWSQAYTAEPSTSSVRMAQLQFSMDLQSQALPDFSRLPPPERNVLPWLFIYTTISLTGGLLTLLYLIVGYWGSLNASRKQFNKMLDRVSRAPSSFFDKTPMGRILNRFTADIGAVDSALLASVRSALGGSVAFIATFAVIVFVVPRFAPLALGIAAIYIVLAPAYVKTARDLRRLESVHLSPAFSGFDELLHGLVHVRAFGMERRFQDGFYCIVDKFQGFDHFYWMAGYLIKVQYDYLGSIIVFFSSLAVLWTNVSEGLAGVAIVNAGVFAEASRQLVRRFAQLELDFNSIERIEEYLKVEQEAPAKSAKPPPAFWPSTHGGISVENLVIRYSPNLPVVLKGISFEIKPREKIGVVGRTGSGKSTLAMSLLRIVEPEDGRIILDGIDITTLGLDELRGNVTIVSQDVALFAGTVRSNLDPFGQHTDAECIDVLERCYLLRPGSHRTDGSGVSSGTETTVTPEEDGWRPAIRSLRQQISPSGSSLSAGERQLLALARAMLRNAKFFILDEASSSIDLETDDKIQRTIREEMADSLVITIAHRLKTIIDYDRILVLDMGEIAEFDSPAALLAREGSFFREMCMQSTDWEEIHRSARLGS